MKPYYEHAGITIYHGDCREILPTLPKFDLLLTDPPYGISVAPGGTVGSHRARGHKRNGVGARCTQYVPVKWDDKPIDAELLNLCRGAGGGR